MKKKFNLEAALKGEAVCRNGIVVRVLYSPEKEHAPIMSVAEVEGGYLAMHHENGEHLSDYRLDLYMAPKKVVRWLNFYEHGVAYYYSTKEEAESMSTSDAIAVAVRVEWEE